MIKTGKEFGNFSLSLDKSRHKIFVSGDFKTATTLMNSIALK